MSEAILPSDSPREPNIPLILTPETVLTPEQIVDGVCRIFDRKASELFMVFSKDRKNHVRVAHDRAKPWVTPIKKHAENCAREIGGMVVPLDEAIKLMMEQELRKHN